MKELQKQIEELKQRNHFSRIPMKRLLPVSLLCLLMITVSYAQPMKPKPPSEAEIAAAQEVLQTAEEKLKGAKATIAAKESAISKAKVIADNAAKDAKAYAKIAADNPSVPAAQARAETTKKTADMAAAILEKLREDEAKAKEDQTIAEVEITKAKAELARLTDLAKAAGVEVKTPKKEPRKPAGQTTATETATTTSKTASPETTPAPPIDTATARTIAGLSVVTFIIFVAGWLLFSLLPIVVAVARHHPNTAVIALIVIFIPCGLGWIIGLIWSFTAIDASKRYR